MAEILREYKEAKVIIEGHTDNQGDDADNLVLSQSRTESVKKYISSLARGKLKKNAFANTPITKRNT